MGLKPTALLFFLVLKMKSCIQCENTLTGRQTKFCSKDCIAKYHNNSDAHRRRNNQRWLRMRIKAFVKLAECWNLPVFTCHNCGDSGIEILQYGHTLGNGKEHRAILKGSYSRGGGSHLLARWVRDATKEEILEWAVKPECETCNAFHARTGSTPYTAL